jgi:hypothetical protein
MFLAFTLFTAAIQLACLSWLWPTHAQTNPERFNIAEIRVPRVDIGPLSPLRLAGPARPGVYLGAVGPEAAWLGFETGEGVGGEEEIVFLRGERVEAEGGRITRLGETGKSILEIPVPDSGPRVVRTVRLRPVR